MGELIHLEEHRRRLRPAAPASGPAGRVRAVFHFDLASPFSYLAAERVERALPGVSWRPTRLAAPDRAAVHRGLAASLRRAAERRAAALRLPLVWPERTAADASGVMRAAAWAAEQGRGAAFVLAASRLAYCGGFDLDDPELLAEAASAAGVSIDAARQAAANPAWDDGMLAAGQRLRAAGVDALPALAVGGRLLVGESRVAEAAALAGALARDARIGRAG